MGKLRPTSGNLAVYERRAYWERAVRLTPGQWKRGQCHYQPRPLGRYRGGLPDAVQREHAGHVKDGCIARGNSRGAVGGCSHIIASNNREERQL